MNAGYSLNLQGKHSCFDVVTVGERSDVVDCYNYDTKQDVLYVFDEAANKIVENYTFPCDIVANGKYPLTQIARPFPTISPATECSCSQQPWPRNPVPKLTALMFESMLWTTPTTSRW